MLKKNLPLLTLLIIILIAAFLRLYRIEDYMSFLGDEGRDVLVVKRIIVDGKFTLLGPITSVGLMHLGPLYYYFMAPFLALTHLNPVGPAIMVALFSLATILLMWKSCIEFFDVKVAMISTLLYSLSPLVIIHAHSSWNPNILPFWATLIIYSLLKVYVKNDFKFLFVAGLAFGVAIQLHYVALVFGAIILCILLLKKFKIPLQALGSLVLGTILTLSPFIIFELRHELINTKTVLNFITRGGDAKSFSLINPIFKFWDLTVRLFWRLVVIENAQYSIIFLTFVLGICLYLLLKRSPANSNLTTRLHLPDAKASGGQVKQPALPAGRFNNSNPLVVLTIWYVIGIGLLSLYTGVTYDYYLMFAFPLPFILSGIALSKLASRNIGKILVIVLVVLISYFQIKVTPVLSAPNRLAAQSREISQFILEKANNEPFNFALLAYKNSDHAYRYFLEIGGNSPIEILNPAIDPDRKSVTKQLFIVCEEKECGPLGHPLWEIAGFGRAEIESEWQVGLFRVFKLIPYISSQEPNN